MAKRGRFTAVVVAATGTWSAEGLCPSGCGDDKDLCHFSLTTYRSYPDVAAFVADNHDGYNLPKGTPVYRFDLADRSKVVDHAFRGAMADDKLPATTLCRLLGKPEPWTPGAELHALDYVSRDIHVTLAREAGIPVQEA